jgi:uncharacterized protein YndB with AHSA1/START domain
MTVDTEPQGSRRGILIIGLGAAIAALTAMVAIVRRSLEREVRIRMSVTIDRPIGEVFDFVSDATNVLRWLPAAVERRKLTDGPVGVGTRFEATDRLGRRLVTHTQEVIEFEPDRIVTSRMSAPWNGEYRIRLEPVAGGTLLSVETTGRPSGAYRLFSLVPDAAMARGFEQDYLRLKDLLEDQKELVAIPVESEAEAVDIEAEELATM